MNNRDGGMIAYQDPNHPGNGPEYRTGKPCYYGCGREAGTWWGKLFCFPCNVERIDRITRQLNEFADKMEAHEREVGNA